MSELTGQHAPQPDDDAVQLSLFGPESQVPTRLAPQAAAPVAVLGTRGVGGAVPGVAQHDDPAQGVPMGEAAMVDAAAVATVAAGGATGLATDPSAPSEPVSLADSLAPEGITTPQPPVIGLRAAVAEYKEYLVALNRSKHTRESFALDLKLLLIHLGDAQVATIGTRELNSFISAIRTQRHNSATSVRRKVATLKGFFSYLHRERIIPNDPSLTLIYPEIYPALPEFLEHTQVEALLAAAAEHDAWLALLTLMLETGLKRDEVVALGRMDVYLPAEAAAESYLVVRETEQAKRLRSRRLELGAEAATLLRAFVAGEPLRERFFDFSPRGVNFIVETCGKRAGIVTRGPRLTPQILRETFAVRQMRSFVTQEARLRAAGLEEETLVVLIEAHDLQLLRLLGLHEDPESAKKYRKLVRGWSEYAQPPTTPEGS